MTTQLSISVIMPVYNAGEYLEASIESVINQTYGNFEFIIVNDGSTDGSLDIIKRYEAKDGRIVVIDQSNKGVAVAMNEAIKKSRGTYIARVDSDDESLPSALSDLLQTAEQNPGSIVICGGYHTIDTTNNITKTTPVPVMNEDIKRAMLFRNPIGNGGTLVRRSSIIEAGGLNKVFAEDSDLWARLYAKGSFVGTGTIVYLWRTNPSGLTLTNSHLSIKKEQENASSLWSGAEKPLLSLKEIVNKLSFYSSNYSDLYSLYRDMILRDIVRFSVQLARHKRISNALSQLSVVAVSSPLAACIILQEGFVVVRRAFSNWLGSKS